VKSADQQFEIGKERLILDEDAPKRTPNAKNHQNMLKNSLVEPKIYFLGPIFVILMSKCLMSQSNVLGEELLRK